jgi:hypothetical protein
VVLAPVGVSEAAYKLIVRKLFGCSYVWRGVFSGFSFLFGALNLAHKPLFSLIH